MKRGLLVFLAICAFAMAMVPKHRRAVNTEEQKEVPTEDIKHVCSEGHTPCAWSVYTPITKIITINITNSYCTCGPDTICVKDEEDLASGAFVYRCRKPQYN